MCHVILSLTLLMGNPEFKWDTRLPVWYGFAPGTPLWVRHAAVLELKQWAAVTGIDFEYDPHFRHYYDGSGILFCLQGNGSFGNDISNVFNLSHTELIQTASQFGIMNQVAKIELNTYFYRFHVGEPYVAEQRGIDNYDIHRVLLREIGKALGLPDTTDPAGAMFPSVHAGPCRLQPSDVADFYGVYND